MRPLSPNPFQRNGKVLQQRYAITGLAVISVIMHLVILLGALHKHQQTLGILASLGLLMSLWVIYLARQEHKPLKAHMVSVAIAGMWLISDLVDDIQTHAGAAPWTVVDAVSMILLLLILLPQRLALPMSVGVYLIFAATVLAAGSVDYTLLFSMGLITGLANYLAIHGHMVLQERELNDALTLQLQYDALTGALTRQAMEQQLQGLVGTGHHMLLMIDIDHFKQVNDQYGHQAGDRALQQVTRVLQSGVREGDLVARWGGEEFLVLLRNVTLEQGKQTAERLRQRVANEQAPDQPRLSISAGGATMLEGRTVQELLARADQRLYEAKAAGRNQVIVQPSSAGA